MVIISFALLQGRNSVSFSKGMKDSLSVFFFYRSVELISASAWLPVVLCRIYWLDISHMVAIVIGISRLSRVTVAGAQSRFCLCSQAVFGNVAV